MEEDRTATHIMMLMQDQNAELLDLLKRLIVLQERAQRLTPMSSDDIARLECLLTARHLLGGNASTTEN